MAKPKLGTKRQCPKCSTRFYDLGKDDPITCVSCEHQFAVEQILKSRRPAAQEAPKATPPAKPKEDKAEDVVATDDDSDDDDEDSGNLGTVLEIDDEDDDEPVIDVKVVPGVDG